MNVTSNVIIDLLPLYLAGEASEDTCKLVEAYVQENPSFREFVNRMEETDNLLVKTKSGPDADMEKVTFERARKQLRRRNLVLGVAIAYSIAPFSFFYGSNGYNWIMLRDAPVMGSVFLVTAIACWIAYFFFWKETRRSGL